MNRIRALSLAAPLVVAASFAHATTPAALDLGTFQAPDGAITVTEGGAIVEPYFALKALLIAKHAGIDVTVPTTRFMAWMVTGATPGGIQNWPRFRRSCRADPGAAWTPCAKADADDALIGLWLDTLAEVPTASPGRIDRAESDKALGALYLQASGVYEINATTPVALLMDNAEIAESFQDRARLAKARREPHTAAKLDARYLALVAALPKVFPSSAGLPAASTQTSDTVAFYPDQVLPMFLEEENIPMRRFSPPLLTYDAWMVRYREAWLSGDADAYPWGLVALVADRHNDEPTVDCWLQRAETLRHGAHWNVMEEAVWQSLLTHRTFPREPLTC